MGFAICIGIFILDYSVIGIVGMSQQGIGWETIFVFAVYVVQTACLGAFVGFQSKQSKAWWFFLGWMLVLINVHLNMVRFTTNYMTTDINALVFAFFSAQIGLVVFWGVLGSEDWRIKLTLSSVLLAVATYPLWTAMSRERWYGAFVGYIIASFITCFVLRRMRFRLGQNEATTENGADNRGQFTVMHLFIWTTVVALLFGIGRFVPWSDVFDELFDFVGRGTASRAVTITVSTAATLWAVMGNRSLMWMRLIGLVFILAGIGFALYSIDTSVKWKIGGWSKTNTEQMVTWMSWSLLNGMFLAGLLLSFRVAGVQLTRSQRIFQSELK